MSYVKKNYQRNYVVHEQPIPSLKVLDNGRYKLPVVFNQPKSHVFLWEGNNQKFDIAIDANNKPKIDVELLDYDYNPSDLKSNKAIEQSTYEKLYRNTDEVNSSYLKGFPSTLSDFVKSLNISCKKLPEDALGINEYGFVFIHTPNTKGINKDYDVFYRITVTLESGKLLVFYLGAYGQGGNPFSQGDINLPQ